VSEPPKGKPGKDPFGPPLEPAFVREVFRRLEARTPAEQRAFVTKVNWNLIDPTVEAHLMAWLARALKGPNREFALGVLDKLPHPKRARHVERFRAFLPDEALQNAFGPVLGGLPKRPGARKPDARPEPKEATGEDLQRLKSFFDKFGGAR
jgi:hypothetical protein